MGLTSVFPLQVWLTLTSSRLLSWISYILPNKPQAQISSPDATLSPDPRVTDSEMAVNPVESAWNEW